MKNQDIRYEELERFFDYLERNRLFSGVVLISEEGKPFYKKAVGKKSSYERQCLDSIFEIASLSKSFTAVAIMLLVEENKLCLNAELTNFFPSLPYKGVTIKNLLNHTSGLPDYMEWFEDQKNWNQKNIVTNKDIVDYLLNEKPDQLFQVNEKWEYCNTGYVLLAVVIEMVSGMAYGDFLRGKIFEPLNLKNTSTYSQFLDDKLKHYSLGFIYDWEKDVYNLPSELEEHKYVYFFDGVKGDGGIKSTVDDLLKWEQSLYKHQLLSKESVECILKPAAITGNVTTGYCPGLHDNFGGYGLGWKLENHSKYGEIVLHDGYWAGYCTGLISYKDDNKTIIMLSNLDFANDKLMKVPHMLILELEKILFHGRVDLEKFESLIN